MYKEKIPWEANYNEASYGTPLTSFWNTGTITDRMPVLAERWSSHTLKHPMGRFRKYPFLGGLLYGYRRVPAAA